MLLVAVRLVARGNHDGPDLSVGGAASLEQGPGSTDVRVEGRGCRAIGDPDQCLGRKVKHGTDLVLPQDPGQKGLIGHVPAHDVDPASEPLDVEPGQPRSVALNHDDAMPEVNAGASQVGSDEPRCTRDKHRAGHCDLLHTFQGASPRRQRASNCSCSL